MKENNEEYGVELVAKTTKFKNSLDELKNKVAQLYKETKNQFDLGLHLNTSDVKKELNKLQSMAAATKAIINSESKNINVDPRSNYETVEKSFNATKKIEKAKEDLEIITSLTKNLQLDFENLNSPIGRLGQLFQSAASRAKQLKESMSSVSKENSKFSVSSKLVNSALQKIEKTTKSFANSVSRSFQKNVNSLKRFAISLFGIHSIYRVVSKAASEYMAIDTELSEKVRSTWAGLGSYLAPIIEYIVSLFQKFLGYINAVVKSLTGVDYIARANKKSVSSLAKATKEANKQLAQFDELYNINNSSNSGSSMDNLIIDVPSIKINNWMEKIIADIKNGDWYSVGKTIAEKLNETLENVDWENIKATSYKFGENIADFFNSGIENSNWNLVGETLGESINVLLNSMYGFVSNFNWTEFGSSLGECLMGAFSKIDWDKIGETIENSINGLLDSMISFLDSLDWAALGNQFVENAKKINWGEVIAKIASLLWEVIKGLIELLAGMFEDTLFGKLMAVITEVVNGDWAGAWEAFKDIFVVNTKEVENKIKDLEKLLEDSVNNDAKNVDAAAFIIKTALEMLGVTQDDITNKTDKYNEAITLLANKMDNVDFNNLEEELRTLGVTTDDVKNNTDKYKQALEQLSLKLIGFDTEEFNKEIEKTQNNLDSTAQSTNSLENSLNKLDQMEVRPDTDGVNNFDNSVKNTIKTLDQVTSKDWMIKSEFAEPSTTKWKNALNDTFSKLNIAFMSFGITTAVPKLATGTNYVPYDNMPAILHKGEAVIPKEFNSQEFFGSFDANRIVDKLNVLIETLENKNMSVNITNDDIGKAAVSYVKEKNRIMGRDILDE